MIVGVVEIPLHQKELFLLLLMLAIAPSLGKNIFLGRAQLFLGYEEKSKIYRLRIFFTRDFRLSST
jgi:hypothetical protein